MRRGLGFIVISSLVFGFSPVEAAKFKAGNKRSCGTLKKELRPSSALLAFFDTADCSRVKTVLDSKYETTEVLPINVVFHVITNADGSSGVVSDQSIKEQIEVLNEDFNAIPGTNGGLGNNAYIRFQLATIDPSGQPTTGITRSSNEEWFNDRGDYWQTLSWDPKRFVNIYTNSAGGYLGYVPFLPADSGGVNVGSPRDRVVVNWQTIGRNTSLPSYNLGRTAVHEIGHYLGLEHTFNGGCTVPTEPECFENGDLICDTNSEERPHFGCSGSTSCGSSDPNNNYMDYSDDLCMSTFTRQQNQRMRCTIMSYRSELVEALRYSLASR